MEYWPKNKVQFGSLKVNLLLTLVNGTKSQRDISQLVQCRYNLLLVKDACSSNINLKQHIQAKKYMHVSVYARNPTINGGFIFLNIIPFLEGEKVTFQTLYTEDNPCSNKKTFLSESPTKKSLKFPSHSLTTLSLHMYASHTNSSLINLIFLPNSFHLCKIVDFSQTSGHTE